MTETTTSNPDPMQTITELVAVLRADVELRTRTLQELNELIERRNSLIQDRVNDVNERTRNELQGQMQTEHERTKRAKWYTGVLGLFAVLIGAVLFYMVFQMANDMNRMEDYMFNMGHADGDHRRVSKHERKVNGVSYMNGMALDMNGMRADMSSMSARMTAMSVDMGTMRGAMGNMEGAIGNMDGTMGTLAGNIGSMGKDMATMTNTMGRMQFNTEVLSQGVGNISSDTRAMGVPFREMNSFMPW